jgi:hypothetical protein
MYSNLPHMNKNISIILCPSISTTFDYIKDSLRYEGFKNVHIAWNATSIINLMPDNKKCIVVCDSALPTDEFLPNSYRVDILAQKLKAINIPCKLILYHTVVYNDYREGIDYTIDAFDKDANNLIIEKIKQFSM